MAEKSEGLRYDAGKERWDLIPPDAMAEIVKVYTQGAQKYTKTKMSNLWNAVNATKIDLFIQKECVVSVMKSNSGKIILNMPNDNEKIVESGRKKTLNENVKWIDVEEVILNCENVIARLNAEITLKNLDLPKKLITNSWSEVVKFVEQNSIYTLITTISRGSLEEYCAVSTTTVSDSLEMTLKVLKPHLDISVLNPVTGDRNWEKGMEWKKCLAPLKRHLWKWEMGQVMDDEYPDLYHMAMVAWNAMALLTYQLRKIGVDNVTLPSIIRLLQEENEIRTLEQSVKNETD